MKTSILPLITGATAYGTFIGALIFMKETAHDRHPFMTFLCAWAIAVFATNVVGMLVVMILPELRFSSNVKIDGMGYVHARLDVIVPFTIIVALISILLALISIFRGVGRA